MELNNARFCAIEEAVAQYLHDEKIAEMATTGGYTGRGSALKLAVYCPWPRRNRRQ